MKIKKNIIKNKHYLNEIMTTYKILIEIYLEKDDEEKRENTLLMNYMENMKFIE